MTRTGQCNCPGSAKSESGWRAVALPGLHNVAEEEVGSETHPTFGCRVGFRTHQLPRENIAIRRVSEPTNNRPGEIQSAKSGRRVGFRTHQIEGINARLYNEIISHWDEHPL